MVTLREVAAAAGVSLMSVSRAIRNQPGVSAETRERILALAAELGYVPPRFALELAPGTRQTRIAGVVIPQLEHTIFPTMLNSMEQVLGGGGYRLLLCCSYGNPLREQHDIAALLEDRVDGLIWSPATLNESVPAARQIRKRQLPLVFLDRKLPGIAAEAVISDDFGGALRAVTHLAAQGCRRIAMLTTERSSWVSRERERGYMRALAGAGLALPAGSPLPCGDTTAAGRAGMAELLARPEPPDAVFAFNDPLVIGAYMLLRERRMAIPGTVALCGFSGAAETALTAVPLSTVRQDGAALGRRAALALLTQLRRGEPGPGRDRMVPTELLIRASSTLDAGR